MTQKVKITYTGEPIRLDKLLTEQLPVVCSIVSTRSQIKQWIEGGRVCVDSDLVSKSGFLVKSGSTLEVAIIKEELADLAPYKLELDVLLEDEDIIVLNKPAGLSMHPGAGNKSTTLANALVDRLGKEFSKSVDPSGRLGIVHRLDKDTTGVVLIAKNIFSHNHLSRQFAAREVSKIYLALAQVTPRRKAQIGMQKEGFITGNIGRDPVNRQRMAVVKSGGRHAETHWKVIENMNHAVLLEVKPVTGRTHQIRVHLNHIGAPIIGDPVYRKGTALPDPLNSAAKSFGRQALHAKSLSFIHPIKLKPIMVEAPLPDDMKNLIGQFRKDRSNS